MQAVAANDFEPSRWVGAAGVLLSLAIHLGTFAALSRVDVAAIALPQDEAVEFSVVETPPPPPPEPEPVVEPPPPEPEPVKPPPRVREAVVKPPEEVPPEPTPEPPAPAEETIADFSGTTLTGQGEGGWLTAVGSGAPMNGPIGKPNAAATGLKRAGVAGGVVGGTGLRVLGDADLGRRAKPPSQDVLNAALERNYPKDARLQGIEGIARVKVRVLASGKLEPLASLSETYPSFADACKRSLREVRFEPALDRAGQPVATDITYSCEFVVE